MMMLIFMVVLAVLGAFLKYMVRTQKEDLALARAKKARTKNLVR